MAVDEDGCYQGSYKRQEKGRENYGARFHQRRKRRKHKQYDCYNAASAYDSGYQRGNKYQLQSHALKVPSKAVVAVECLADSSTKMRAKDTTAFQYGRFAGTAGVSPAWLRQQTRLSGRAVRAFALIAGGTPAIPVWRL